MYNLYNITRKQFEYEFSKMNVKQILNLYGILDNDPP